MADLNCYCQYCEDFRQATANLQQLRNVYAGDSDYACISRPVGSSLGGLRSAWRVMTEQSWHTVEQTQSQPQRQPSPPQQPPSPPQQPPSPTLSTSPHVEWGSWGSTAPEDRPAARSRRRPRRRVLTFSDEHEIPSHHTGNGGSIVEQQPIHPNGMLARLRNHLHLHEPGSVPTEDMDPLSEQTVGDNNRTFESDEDGKFMVCDHCHAHGLKCNEGPFCDQCRAYEQPCVHRLCRMSPGSRVRCPEEKCRYVHRDWMPSGSNEPIWVVLEGKLPPHFSRGKILNRPWDPRLNTVSLVREFDRQQHIAKRHLQARAAEGSSSLRAIWNGCDCEETLYDGNEDVHVQES